jgi:hypothetical protein
MPAKQRKKPPPQTTRDYLTTLEHAIRQLSYSQHLFTTFRHFVELSAIAFSNVADPINKDTREAQYLAIVKQYKPEAFQKFPELLGMLTLCLEQESKGSGHFRAKIYAKALLILLQGDRSKIHRVFHTVLT